MYIFWSLPLRMADTFEVNRARNKLGFPPLLRCIIAHVIKRGFLVNVDTIAKGHLDYCNSLLFNTPATHIYQDSAITGLYDFVKGAIRSTCSRKHLLVTPRASVSMISRVCLLSVCRVLISLGLCYISLLVYFIVCISG